MDRTRCLLLGADRACDGGLRGLLRGRGSHDIVVARPVHVRVQPLQHERELLPQLLPPALRVRTTGRDRVHGKHRLSLPTINEAPGLRRHHGRGGQVQQDGRVRRGDRAAGAAEAEPLRRGRRGAGAVHHCSEFTRRCPAHWQPWARDTAIGWSLVATGVAWGRAHMLSCLSASARAARPNQLPPACRPSPATHHEQDRPVRLAMKMSFSAQDGSDHL
jgi:hypothetical protein